MQPKNVAAAQQRTPPQAPPVYRPESKLGQQQKVRPGPTALQMKPNPALREKPRPGLQTAAHPQTPPAGRGVQAVQPFAAIPAKPISRRNLIQRKIGFEFEAATREGWKVHGKKLPTDGFKLIKDTKEALYEDVGAKFEVQADRGHIEFVTKPLSTWGEVTTALTAMINLINSWKGKTFEVAAGTGNWRGPVGYTTYKLDCHGNLIAKPQVSFGFRLSHVGRVTTTLTNYEKERGAYFPDVSGSLQYGAGDAERAITEGIDREVRRGVTNLLSEEDVHEMIGLLHLILTVFYQAHFNSGRKLEDAKYAFFMMHRTDFVSMYRNMESSARVWFYHLWDHKLIQDYFEPKYFDAHVFTAGYLDVNQKWEQGPTREQFVDSIFTATSNKDILSPPPGYPSHSSTPRPEGLGAMGADPTENKLNVFEIRSLLGGDKTIAVNQWEAMVREVTEQVAKATGDNNLMPR